MGIVTIGNISSTLAMISCLVVGIAPLVGAAIVGVLGSILGGVGKSSAEKAKAKRRLENLARYKSEILGGKPFSGGVDPAYEQMMAQSEYNRGMRGDPANDPIQSAAAGNMGPAQQPSGPPGSSVMGGMARPRGRRGRV